MKEQLLELTGHTFELSEDGSFEATIEGCSLLFVNGGFYLVDEDGVYGEGEDVSIAWGHFLSEVTSRHERAVHQVNTLGSILWREV